MNYSLAEQKQIEANIWKYTINLVTNKRVFAAILSLYYLTIPNVEIQNVGWVMFCGSVAAFLFEIPSGYLSDKIGHKNTMVLGKVALIISSLLFIFANNFTLLILGAVMMNISSACFSGTGNAFMHDTLKAIGKDDQYSKIMGKASSIGFAIPITFMVLTPFLVSHSYKLPFVLALVLDIIGLIAVLSFKQVEHSEEHKKEIKETSLKQVFKQGIELGYMPFAMLGAFIGAIVFTIQVYRAPYQEFIGADVIWFGVYFGLGRAMVSLIAAYSGRLKECFDIYSYQRFKILIYLVFLLTISFVDNVAIILIAFIICNGFQWGLGSVSSHFMLEIIGDSKFKATLMSIKGQINQAIVAVGMVAMGQLLSLYSYQTTFLIFTIIFAVICGSLYLNIIIKTKGKLSKREL